MSTTDVRLPKPHPNVVWTPLPDGAVLYATDSEQYFGVNCVAALVWELLPPVSADFESLCRQVHAGYPDTTYEQIRTDVRELLDMLHDLGLVQHAEDI